MHYGKEKLEFPGLKRRPVLKDRDSLTSPESFPAHVVPDTLLPFSLDCNRSKSYSQTQVHEAVPETGSHDATHDDPHMFIENFAKRGLKTFEGFDGAHYQEPATLDALEDRTHRGAYKSQKASTGSAAGLSYTQDHYFRNSARIAALKHQSQRTSYKPTDPPGRASNVAAPADAEYLEKIHMDMDMDLDTHASLVANVELLEVFAHGEIASCFTLLQKLQLETGSSDEKNKEYYHECSKLYKDFGNEWYGGSSQGQALDVHELKATVGKWNTLNEYSIQLRRELENIWHGIRVQGEIEQAGHEPEIAP